MGDVIRFPDASCPRAERLSETPGEPATVIILPVIRVERDPDGSNDVAPQPGSGAGRRRRRRLAR